MLKIGLTGGIASGKSAAASYFAAHGVPVIDADLLAREVVRRGSSTLKEIVAAFGPEILDKEGNLDRTAMRKIVFSNILRRRQLEAIMHPRIKALMQSRIAELSAPYCILAIPLLIEANQQDLVDRILVIDAPTALQIDRLMNRDNITRQTAENILGAQIEREARLQYADDVVVNDGSIAALEDAIEKLHQKYLSMTTAA